VVTSTISVARRAWSSLPRRSPPRSASAASIAPRTSFATAPTLGRSSGGSAPIPRSTSVSRPFRPRTSSSIASSVATSPAAAIEARASSRSPSRSRVRSVSSTRPSSWESETPDHCLWPRVRSVAWSGALHGLDDLRKRRGVADGDVGERLAVELDLGLLQAGDERAVGHAVLAGRRVDPDDPQLAHLALALLAVAGRVGHRVEVRLARCLDQPGLRPLAAFGRVQQALVSLVGGDAALDSCHRVRVLLEVRQQAADLLGVDVLHQRLAGVAA